MTVWYDDGSHGTTLYSRYLMEQHLGRRLDPVSETVDHINDDFTDDRIDNLQLMTRADNARKSARPRETMDFTCPIRLTDSVGRARNYRQNQLVQGKSGPYCSKSCAGKAPRRYTEHGAVIELVDAVCKTVYTGATPVSASNVG